MSVSTEPPLRLDDAARRIAASISPIVDVESVPLRAARGRVLARDLISRRDVPAHDNAAMDGYAVASTANVPSRIVGRALAGHPYAETVAEGRCVRIMTGAVLPRGCVAVVPQEACTIHDDTMTFAGELEPGQHVRRAGEDVRGGSVTLTKGRVLRPADLGLAASIGEPSLTVVRRARVAIFSTGSELRDADRVLDAGSVHDSNRYALIAMLERRGADVLDMGIVGDDPRALEAVIASACRDGADAIVTSGGVSGGDADHTRDVMRRIGDVAFWKLAIKPGRPMAFGRVVHDGRSALLFALPGNPVAAMVVFHALVRDALSRLAGAAVEAVPAIVASCTMPLAKTIGRTEFVRAVASRVDGRWQVRPTIAQGSGVLRSMTEANCLVVLDHDRGPVAKGDTVEAWPFDGLD